nr:ribonuclease HI family protein [Hippea jasoniae]
MDEYDFFLHLKNSPCAKELAEKNNLDDDKVNDYFLKILDCLKKGSFKSGRLFVDGASSGNPGKAGIGVVLQIEDDEFELSESIGVTTNNVAEYKALIEGLKLALDKKIDSIEVFSDSQLVVKQIKGEYAVKDDQLKRLHKEANKLIKRFKSFNITHIPRGKNKKADMLAKSAAV